MKKFLSVFFLLVLSSCSRDFNEPVEICTLKQKETVFGRYGPSEVEVCIKREISCIEPLRLMEEDKKLICRL